MSNPTLCGPNLHLLRLLCWGMLTLLAAGCVQPIPPVAQELRLAANEASSNRLLVLGIEGNLFTIAPDGTGQLNLTGEATTSRFYTQPTWSPTGERIAWVELNRTTNNDANRLITVAADGSNRTEALGEFPPFYLHWNPLGTQVAFLSNWVANEPIIALNLVDLTTGGGTIETLGVGQPFYFSWAPDGSELLTHISNRRVGRLSLDGSEQILSEQSASFAAPQWSQDGERLLYGITEADRPQLILSDRTGIIQERITFFEQGIRTAFSLNPSGQQIAFTESDAPVSANSYGPLFLFDLESKGFQQLTTEPVIAFFWNPAGDKLLYMSVAFEGERPWLHLYVWDGERNQPFNRFVPSGLFFNQYLPFADQYAQSTRFWSPDGQAFVYAGEGENGQRGIWVQSIDGSAPTLISPGVLASWSPR